YASELLQHVVNMNNGRYLHEDMENSEKTDFCVGVAGYPEKHFESPNLDTDFKYLKKKVELGSDFIVTQMFFDNSKYKAFVDNYRAKGIQIRISQGLKRLSSNKYLVCLAKIFRLEITLELSGAVQACKTEQEVRDVGVEWMIQQCKELKAMDAPVLHFYTMGNPKPTKRIIEAVF